MFAISQFTLAALIILVVLNIILRKVWHAIFGTYDFVGFMTSVIVAFGVGYLALRKGHIAVDMLMEKFPQRVQAWIDSITSLLSFGIFGVVTWQCVVFGNAVLKSGERSMTSLTPFYPFLWGLALGFAILCLVLFMDFIKNMAKAVKG